MTDTSPAALRALANAMDSYIAYRHITPGCVFAESHEIAATLRALAAEKEAGAPAPDAEGWIPWEGGGCPVAEGTRVRVRYCTGAEDEDYAGAWFWSNFDADPIIAYRIAKES